MKTKVAYILTFLMLSGMGLKGQKPTFDLLPSGKQQKIPEELVDTKYYNDTSQRSHIMAVSNEDSIKKVEDVDHTKSMKINRQGKREVSQASESIGRKLFYLIYPPRLTQGVVKLFLRVYFNTP